MLIVASLMFTVVLLMMIGAFMMVTRQGARASLRHADNAAALYAAEAGVADAVAQLSRDHSWAPAEPYVVSLPNGQGRYEIQFSGEVAQASVNNLGSYARVDGPRGEDTVPPGSADVVVTGWANGVSRRLEVVLKSNPFSNFSSPLVASGRMRLAGSLIVNGREAFGSSPGIEVGLHSNSEEDVAGVIRWNSVAGDAATISGVVTASSPNSASIGMSGGAGVYTSAGEKSDEPQQAFPALDIESAIANASGATPLTPNSFGVTVIAGGDYRYDGGPINGDLLLENANLFVSGDLVVNGSISGSGTVYVDGDTEFSGAATVSVGGDGHVALMSRGNVHLKGFDGNRFLAALAASRPDDFGRWYQNTSDGLDAIKDIIGDGSNYGQPGSSWGGSVGGGGDGVLDAWRRLLGQDTVDLPRLLPDDLVTGLNDYTPLDSDSLGKMAGALEELPSSDPDSATASFLAKKLRDVDRMFEGLGTMPTADEIDAYVNGGPVPSGLMNVLVDESYPSAVGTFLADIDRIEFDRLGSCYFRGIVYTNGSLICDNDLEVLGGIFAEKNQRSPQDGVDWGGETLVAGELGLKNGVRVTYVKELFDSPAGLVSAGPVSVVNWIDR